MRWWTAENHRLRSERDAEIQAAQTARAEVQRQARTIEALFGRGGSPGVVAVPSAQVTPMTPNPYGGAPPSTAYVRQSITDPRAPSAQAPGAHYRNADPFARGPSSSGGY